LNDNIRATFLGGGLIDRRGAVAQSQGWVLEFWVADNKSEIESMSKLISSAMNTKLNAQVTNEMGASLKYLAMACAFEEMGLKILAKRFGQQSDEERAHALKILGYIQQVGGTVKVDAVPKPTGSFSDPMKILKGALDAELKVTQQINDLAALAEKEKDYATRSFMNWFVDEQV